MTLFQAILWSILIYLLFNTIRNVMKFLSPGPPKTNSNEIKKQKKSKYQIEKDDVIEAHFEEIDSAKSDKSKDNS